MWNILKIDFKENIFLTNIYCVNLNLIIHVMGECVYSYLFPIQQQKQQPGSKCIHKTCLNRECRKQIATIRFVLVIFTRASRCMTETLALRTLLRNISFLVRFSIAQATPIVQWNNPLSRMPYSACSSRCPMTQWYAGSPMCQLIAVPSWCISSTHGASGGPKAAQQLSPAVWDNSFLPAGVFLDYEAWEQRAWGAKCKRSTVVLYRSTSSMLSAFSRHY